MITATIFSKNRACQLHLLLESLSRNINSVFRKINILYYADEPFIEGYKKTQKYFPYYKWIEEWDFHSNTLDLIENADDYICFFVDDNFLHRNIPWNAFDIITTLEENNIEIMSLRLGKNTIIQNWYTQSRTPLPFHIEKVDDNDIFGWDWTLKSRHTNFGYPFSVDGHIYKKDTLLKTLNYNFDTPNAFEGRFDVKQLPHYMCCFGKSVVVNNPLNLVGSSENLAGQTFGYSLEELNQMYLDGYIISLNELCKNKIIACHQEMEICLTDKI